MMEIREPYGGDEPPTATLTLPFEQRQRSRLRARLDDGREVGLFLPRGTVLRGGDRLRAADGTVVAVVAANERVSTVRADGIGPLVHAAYHLGNRHVPLQIGPTWLRYEHDHVLDAMVRGFGLEVLSEDAPFEPESGAYAKGHSHGHGHHHHHEGDAEPTEGHS